MEPGFNSGWNKIQGLWKPIDNPVNHYDDLIVGDLLLNLANVLVNFKGKGKYSAPEFIWE